MAFKFVALLALVASASAGLVPSGHLQAYFAPATVVKASYAAPASNSGYSAPEEYAQQAVGYHQQVAYAQPATQQQVVYAQPAVHVVKAQPVLTKAVDDYDPHPQYKFGYDVQDTISGDSKSQVESRDGDLVQGEYSLIDADGYRRTVQYTADSVHGFNAIVNREPIGVKTIVKTPVAYAAAPTQLTYAARPAQSGYASGPVVKGAYAATPVVKATPVAYPLSEEEH